LVSVTIVLAVVSYSVVGAGTIMCTITVSVCLSTISIVSATVSDTVSRIVISATISWTASRVTVVSLVAIAALVSVIVGIVVVTLLVRHQAERLERGLAVVFTKRDVSTTTVLLVGRFGAKHNVARRSRRASRNVFRNDSQLAVFRVYSNRTTGDAYTTINAIDVHTNVSTRSNELYELCCDVTTSHLKMQRIEISVINPGKLPNLKAHRILCLNGAQHVIHIQGAHQVLNEDVALQRLDSSRILQGRSDGIDVSQLRSHYALIDDRRRSHVDVIQRLHDRRCTCHSSGQCIDDCSASSEIQIVGARENARILNGAQRR
jgi:hypothetical protein